MPQRIIDYVKPQLSRIPFTARTDVAASFKKKRLPEFFSFPDQDPVLRTVSDQSPFYHAHLLDLPQSGPFVFDF
uniref:Uncharacterized protein n=1 Tax=Hyaloperonospora arabidopsidis (strain Emoy2) TaxID=559515 RepID=M4BGU5_HYAAE